MDRRDLTPTSTPTKLRAPTASQRAACERTAPASGQACFAEPTACACPDALRPSRPEARRARRILAARLPAAVRSLAGARALARACEGQGGTVERLARAEAAYWQIAS